jgi:hypothetical protein
MIGIDFISCLQVLVLAVFVCDPPFFCRNLIISITLVTVVFVAFTRISCMAGNLIALCCLCQQDFN